MSSSSGSQDIQRQVDSIQREFSRLEDQAEFTDVHSTIGQIEERLAEYPLELKALEQRGYLHTRQIHELLDMLKGQWRKTAPQLRLSLRKEENKITSAVKGTSRLVSQAKSGRQSSIASAKKSLDDLERKLRAADQTLRSQYGNTDSELYGVKTSLTRAEWMMDQLDESSEIKLRTGEGPLLAVESEWHRDKDEGPKGLLFLTDQRLLFEQKEKIVTKKRFGIFTAESKMVQKLWIDVNVNDIESVKDSEEGGFLGMGKDDILELTFSGKAAVSRARFHLKGQDSADWRTEIKRSRSGEIANERNEAAGAAYASQALSFPSQCPNCLAPLPEPHRGATYLTCEFCGTSVGPKESDQ
ncbi:MAG: hypothetical protein BMS9Abin02_1121 [Anaerolineae bacterium]|nr:MAG: hypothetical protein BMS9Abin02_1121 [Anaerolineae bacterium]